MFPKPTPEPSTPKPTPLSDAETDTQTNAGGNAKADPTGDTEAHTGCNPQACDTEASHSQAGYAETATKEHAQARGESRRDSENQQARPHRRDLPPNWQTPAVLRPKRVLLARRGRPRAGDRKVRAGAARPAPERGPDPRARGPARERHRSSAGTTA